MDSTWVPGQIDGNLNRLIPRWIARWLDTYLDGYIQRLLSVWRQLLYSYVRLRKSYLRSGGGSCIHTLHYVRITYVVTPFVNSRLAFSHVVTPFEQRASPFFPFLPLKGNPLFAGALDIYLISPISL